MIFYECIDYNNSKRVAKWILIANRMLFYEILTTIIVRVWLLIANIMLLFESIDYNNSKNVTTDSKYNATFRKYWLQ